MALTYACVVLRCAAAVTGEFAFRSQHCRKQCKYPKVVKSGFSTNSL